MAPTFLLSVLRDKRSLSTRSFLLFLHLFTSVVYEHDVWFIPVDDTHESTSGGFSLTSLPSLPLSLSPISVLLEDTPRT